MIDLCLNLSANINISMYRMVNFYNHNWECTFIVYCLMVPRKMGVGGEVLEWKIHQPNFKMMKSISWNHFYRRTYPSYSIVSLPNVLYTASQIRLPYLTAWFCATNVVFDWPPTAVFTYVFPPLSSARWSEIIKSSFALN